MAESKKTRFVQGTALMREDVVTPMHHHDQSQDALLVKVDGVTRHMFWAGPQRASGRC